MEVPAHAQKRIHPDSRARTDTDREVSFEVRSDGLAHSTSNESLDVSGPRRGANESLDWPLLIDVTPSRLRVVSLVVSGYVARSSLSRPRTLHEPLDRRACALAICPPGRLQDNCRSSNSAPGESVVAKNLHRNSDKHSQSLRRRRSHRMCIRSCRYAPPTNAAEEPCCSARSSDEVPAPQQCHTPHRSVGICAESPLSM